MASNSLWQKGECRIKWDRIILIKNGRFISSLLHVCLLCFTSACDVGVCVLVDDPHCGTDGDTYSTLCALKQAKCNALELDVAYRGQCLGRYSVVYRNILWNLLSRRG